MNAREPIAELGARFAARAGELAEGDQFVAGNYEELRASGLLAAGVPAELGGQGMEVGELAAMLATLARACPSTALAFSMHTHIVALAAWRWRHQKAPTGPMLEKVARERLVLISTGGGDWLESSGEAVPADGGYRVSARKAFCSGVPAGDLLVTSAVTKGDKGEEVIHFAVPLKAAGVTIEPTWRTLGMRNTASHDVRLENVFVPEGAVTARRPRGKWHPLFDMLSMIALPLIYAVYLGVAQAARERALEMVRGRRADDALLQQVGEMENQLAAAQIAHADWLACAAEGRPGAASTARCLIDRTLVARGVLGTLDAAMGAAGGAAFFRRHRLEQLFRDAQGARFHPLQEAPQRALAAKVALGLPL
ncbi:MAG TPA: acyl-CoA dehydrogenase family protein [Burkholderiales bacterium]